MAGYTSLPRIYLTALSGDAAYNLHARVGDVNHGQDMLLRLDIIQPEGWVMNANSFYDCSYLDSWFDSEESLFSISSYPPLLTQAPEYRATICAMGGRYTNSLAIGSGLAVSTSVAQPAPTVAGIANDAPHRLPYFNGNNVLGVWQTNNLSINVSSEAVLALLDFTFLDASISNLYYGGLGLAGNPRGSGFLYGLRDRGVIPSPGYSVWFQNRTMWEASEGVLMPGYVDALCFEEPFYSYLILPHEGPTDSAPDVILPALLLDDLSVKNTQSGQTVSLKTNNASIPVVLDTRSYLTYLPVNTIINLAMQVNAFYSEDVNQWLVGCDRLKNASATVNFRFDDLEISLPLSKFIAPFYYDDTTVKFPDGSAACNFLFLPSSVIGYNTLGLPFMSSIYFAVDNEGRNIAIARSNATKSGSIDFDPPASSLSTVLGPGSFENATLAESIAYITSGYIPFATSKSKPSTTLTITRVQEDDEFGDGGNVPARFSGYISDGVFVTHPSGYSTSTLPGGAPTAGSAGPSTRSHGNKIRVPFAIITSNLWREVYVLGWSSLFVLVVICAM
ncbi:acid protease [Suhomyces tanzawaensis NRRL Y-17324]|uniref:Acid protease n=1 Tax=Suhomyces tanzawaensis NRRL Y-17324 TaxID=984487 RepID=A0A1E4SJV6_9ASCO|nr:acid protease [Suhomyces tanzawaensis NRRL Y-17324]ODV79717.1 acid protease [Suhomyces tanzawaensis NRRL Y-17324]